jgi:hypothetical protein
MVGLKQGIPVERVGGHMHGYLAHKKPQPSTDHHRALAICILQNVRGPLFLISELPLYC